MGRAAIVGLLMLTAAACVSPTTTLPAPVTSAASPAATRSTAVTANPLAFSVGALQARFVATTIAFFDAYNAGDVAAALTLVTADIVGGDCDYHAGQPVQWHSATEFELWLRARAADHDRFQIARIFNENPDPTGGSFVVGVVFAGRTSDALRALGHDPLTDLNAAKLVFTDDGRRIKANPTAGGGPGRCRL